MNSKLTPYPKKPGNSQTQNAFIIFSNAYDTSSAFLSIFETTRKNRKARGTPTDEEQDLLRAMFIFATSGLDSMIKQLTREALSLIIEKDEGSEKRFQSHIEKKMTMENQLNISFMTSVLVNKEPRKKLIDEVIRDLTSTSLQSKNELLKVASYFNIPSEELTKDFAFLKKIFDVRNQIAHEMDIDFEQSNRNRRPRRKGDMIDYTNAVLKIGGKFLEKVDKKL